MLVITDEQRSESALLKKLLSGQGPGSPLDRPVFSGVKDEVLVLVEHFRRPWPLSCGFRATLDHPRTQVITVRVDSSDTNCAQ